MLFVRGFIYIVILIVNNEFWLALLVNVDLRLPNHVKNIVILYEYFILLLM